MDTGPITVSRFVAFILTPIIVSASTWLANEVQVIFGANLDGAQLAVYLSSVALPVGAACVTWLLNRGRYEIAKVNAVNAAGVPPTQ
jgi:general stress protein CsbA